MLRTTVDDMNDSEFCAQASRYYDQLKIVIDLKDFESSTQGSRCYKEIRVRGVNE